MKAPKQKIVDSLDGLNSRQAQELLEQIGPNIISAPKASHFKKVIRWLRSPMSILLLVAMSLSFYSGKAFDGWFIFGLLIFNFMIEQWHEFKADKAIATLQEKLTVNVQTKRDGKWCSVISGELVPGDVVKLGVGDVVPADTIIIKCNNLSINEAALTGESLPIEKNAKDMAYTGSFVTTGNMLGKVEATALKTKFGRAVSIVDDNPKDSSLERDILTISKSLMLVSLLSIGIISIYFILRHQQVSELLRLNISILIAGVPVAMPTVMSLIISLGVLQLTRKNVVVRRLSSLEDLANVNLLLSDKTGTLTKNEIAVEDIIVYGDNTEQDVINWAASATADNQHDPINQAILEQARSGGANIYEQSHFIPADSKRKRSTAIVEKESQKYIVSLGASQIVGPLCKMDEPTKTKFDSDVRQAATDGYRSLVLASKLGTKESGMTLMGILLLSDTLRHDAKDVIDFLNSNGITVKMMTGDNVAIASRVANDLGMTNKVMAAANNTASLTREQLDETSVFAEVLPEDKFRIVEYSSKYYVNAVTGDGVNDLPALKRASVGIAVNSSVDALKSAADIVLMTDGIGVIREAIIEARKIFLRTYYYSIYRISESLRLIISIVVLSVAYGSFPITPVQIILLALLNDLPIITLAYDKVEPSIKPEVVHVKQRFALAMIFGLIGVLTSVTLFYISLEWLHLSLPVIQTMFFLKLAISGHMLIYVAHTKHLWWRALPSKQVIQATTITQLIATFLALSGVLFQQISWQQALFVWGWALIWMQVSELAKHLFDRSPVGALKLVETK